MSTNLPYTLNFISFWEKGKLKNLQLMFQPAIISEFIVVILRLAVLKGWQKKTVRL